MSFNLMKVLKGLLISESDTLTPKEIQIQPGGTASTKTTIQSSQSSNVTLTLPDATDTLVGKATTDTLTNKTIDAEGTGNSITNLKDANIKAAAAIAFSKMASLTANRALTSSVAGVVTTSSVTDTELGYLSGVTSAIQTQLNGKEPSITTLPISKGGTNSSTALNNNRIIQSSGGSIVEAAAITADRVLISDANGIPTHSTITSTTLGYLDVTSSIQTQLNGKEPTITTLQMSRGGTGSTSFTAGSVVFSDGTKLTENNSKLFFDSTNGRLGINTNTITTSAILDLSSTTGALLVPRMTTTQRNDLTPTNGMIVYDSTAADFYLYKGGSWTGAGSSVENSFTIANNQSSVANVTSLSFAVATYRAFAVDYSIRRYVDASEVVQTGTLKGAYNSKTSTWSLSDSFTGDDAGVTFSITAAGQVQYVSSNISGTNYVGSLKYYISKTFTV